MIISKSGKLKALRFLGVFCVIIMGFMTLVGTSEDDAKDTLGLTVDFDEDATLSLDSVTVNDTVNTLSIQAVGDSNCGSTSINGALDAANIEDLDRVDIDSVDLNSLEGTYTATWEPDTVTSFTCSLTISGSQPDITIAETVINGATGVIDNLLTQEQIDVINYYLSNRDEVFSYCATCTGTDEIDTFSVTYDIDLDVNIQGTI
jgi:hypothetical protein